MRTRSSITLLTIALSVGGATTARAQVGPAMDPSAVLSTWFRHIERDELDSLRPLLTPDFVFVSDGARMGPDAFVAMIKSLGIVHPRVRLSNIDVHALDSVAYLVYDRTESWHSQQ